MGNLTSCIGRGALRSGILALLLGLFTTAAAWAASGPYVYAVSPSRQVAGGIINLGGNTFTGVNTVTFAGTSNNVVTSGFTVVANAYGTYHITGIVVPSGAISGNITLSGTGGTSSSVVEFTVGTPVSNALHFDGVNDYLSLFPTPALSFGTNPFALEAWVKTTASSTGLFLIMGVSSGDDYWLGMLNGKAAFGVRGQDVNSTSNINDGLWHHVAGVRTSASQTLIYVDGVQQGSRGISGGANGGTALGIGQYGTTNQFFWNGTVDEVKVWSTTRSAAQVQADMASISGTGQTGMTSYYTFDQGTANATNQALNTTVYDQSASASDAGFSGFAFTGTTSNYVAGISLTAPLVISSTSPAANAKAASASGPVAITFDQAITAGSTAALKVFSAQRGGLRSNGSGTTSVSGSTLSFAPTYAFKAGETVQATVKTTATASAGGALATARVLQFTAATAGGTGTLLPGSNVAAGFHVGTVSMGDVDNDGDLDMLTTYGGGNSVSVWLNNGSGSYGSPTVVAAASGASNAVLADVDGDGDLDMLTANNGANSVSVRFNSAGTFSGSTDVAAGVGPIGVATGDVDGDGDLDFVAANYTGGNVSVRFNDGSGSFSGTAAVAVAGNPGNVVLGDVDSDGDLDMMVSNNTGSTVSLRINDGSGNFSGSTAVAVGAGAGSVALGDIDGDGDLDLLATSNTNTVSVRFNSAGTFSGTTAVGVGAGPGSMTLADMDGDGDLDFLCSNYTSSSISVRFNDGSGSFSGTSNAAVDTNPNCMVVGDVDGDGDIDALTANYTAGTVSVRLNQAPGALTISTGTLASPTAIPAGTYTTITVTNTGVAQLAGNTTATTAVLVNGTLLTNCQALTGAGSFTLAAGGTLGICSAAGIAASGATGAVQTTGARSFSTDASYLYNGTVAQATGTGLPATVRSLGVNNSAGVSLSGVLAVRQLVTLTSGNLTTTPALNLTLLSVAGQGTALVNNIGGAVVGTANVMQRAVDITTSSNDGYHHYASPMTATTVGDLSAPGFTPVFNAGNYNTAAQAGAVRPFPTVFGYDESRVGSTTLATDLPAFEQGYVTPASSTTAMAVGKGYTANVANAVTVDFVGSFTTGAVNLTGLTRGANAQSGWQLLGNPYPSPLDWSAVAKSGLDAAMYLFHATSTYGGYYTTYLGTPNGTTIAGSPIIDAGSGFFVRTSTAGTPGTVSLANANRVTTYAAQPAFGRTANTLPTVALHLSSAAGTDAFTLYAAAGATTGVDAQYDAVKLANPSGLNLAAVLATGELLAIDGLPAFATAQRIALKVGVPANGSYTLSAATLANLPATTAITLTDALTGTTTDLRRTTSYSFTAVATAPAVGRFFLNLTPAASALATTTEVFANAVTLYPNPTTARATVLVPAVVGAAKVTATVLNALGQVVLTYSTALSAAGASLSLDVAGLARGVYTLRLAAGATTATKRLVLE